MLNIGAFVDVKNQWYGKNFVLLFEMTFDLSDPLNPAYLRFAKYDKTIVFEGHEWTAFAIAGIEVTENLRGEVPAFDIAISNAGRVLMSIMEFNIIEGMRGRLLWVHPDRLADSSAKRECKFTVMLGRAEANVAVLTVAPVPVDVMNLMLPKGVVSIDEYPGVVGTRARFMV